MSGMSWAGIIASAAAAGGAGAMGSVAQDIGDQQKAEIQRQRDKALADLAQQTHKANLQAGVDSTLQNADAMTAAKVKEQAALEPGKVQEAGDIEAVKNKTRIVPSGSRLIDNDGNIIVDAVEKPMSDEERALYKARVANELASADAHRSTAEKNRAAAENPKSDKTTKFDVPDFKPAPNLGRNFSIDTKTGITKEEIKGSAAVPEDKGILGTGIGGSPAKEAIAPKMVYRDANGQILSPDQYFGFYPKSLGAQASEDSGSYPSTPQPAPPSPAASSQSKSPYPEGTRLKGKDGRNYIVKNGAPVPI